MEFAVSLTIDNKAERKSVIIENFFKEINFFVKSKEYGEGINQYLIILYVINPPVGYEHLHKDFKPKFVEYKSLTNNLTGEPFIIEKQFSYSLKINGENFEEFVSVADEQSKKLLAKEILNSLYNLDALPKKVKDFDKERFKADLKQFFKEQDLI